MDRTIPDCPSKKFVTSLQALGVHENLSIYKIITLDPLHNFRVNCSVNEFKDIGMDFNNE